MLKASLHGKRGFRVGKICVVGLGYIGLPTATVFAGAGYDVVGVDINEEVIALLEKGQIMIEEVGLLEEVRKVVKSGKLRASLTPEEADVFIIAVPTPINHDQTANLDYVVAATSSILPYLQKGNIVVIESTIPPRTVEDVVAPIIKAFGVDPVQDIHLVHCPERVLPGRILHEMRSNPRIVGGYTKEASEKAADVYRRVVTGEVVETEATIAEMAKLMENTYRDVNIALANELVKISSKLHINAYEVIRLANKHPRVHLHSPGPGVGGHCLAVDPYFIVEKAPEEAKLISQAREVNSSMPSFVIEQIVRLTASLFRAKIAVLGLTYKENIDDVRESPSLQVIQLLQQYKEYDVYPHDPHVQQGKVNVPLYSLEEALTQADLVVVLVEHHEFEHIQGEQLLKSMNRPVVLDCKNCVKIADERIKVYRLGDAILQKGLD